MESPLTANLADLDVENIYIYAADAVRYDYLPPEIAHQGITVKTIAGGIHSPTGFASIVSGLYASQHGVFGFHNCLPPSAPSLLRSSTHETAYVNTINHKPFNDNSDSEGILANTLRTDDNPTDTINEIEPPFLLLERGPGGHAPYGDFQGNAWEYFRDRKASSPSKFVQEYENAVRRDRRHFEHQLSQLRDRGLLEDTLVLYTSDHGELLGETGMLGHNGPIHRHLVEVPTVFIHPLLQQYRVAPSIIRHVDLAPTVSEIADLKFESERQPVGRNLAISELPSVGASFYKKTASVHPSLPPLTFSYESVWDAHGGYIIPRSNTSIRLAAWIKFLTKSAKREFAQQNWKQNLVAFARGEHRQGTPTTSYSEALDYLQSISGSHLSPPDEDLDVPKERLRELGYLDG